MGKRKYTSVADYFHDLPEEWAASLALLRKTIQEAIPEAREVISYNMPAFAHRHILLYYAAYPKHIGFYPTPSAIAAFRERLDGYVFSKGSVQFTYGQDLPLDLIADIARYRWREDAEQA